jgi:hypothetical protein
VDLMYAFQFGTVIMAAAWVYGAAPRRSAADRATRSYAPLRTGRAHNASQLG